MTSSFVPAANSEAGWNLPWPRLSLPSFKEMDLGPWSIRWMAPLSQWRYFQSELVQAGQYTLQTAGESWMSTAPVEIEGQAHHVAAAHGHVVVMGAGLGVALYNILPKPEVTRVTLVERDPRVIELLCAAADLPRWEGYDKLTIEIGDACEYASSEAVDLLYVDIWARPGESRALPDTQQMQRRVRAAAVGWWTQEIFFLRWLEQRGGGLFPSLDLYREWAHAIGLPLIEQDNPVYLQCIAALAGTGWYRDVRGKVKPDEQR